MKKLAERRRLAMERRNSAADLGAPSPFDAKHEPPPPLTAAGSATLEARASAVMRKALKEVAILGRRAKYGWRHLHAGVLAFQTSAEAGGGAMRRTFAVGKKLGEGGYGVVHVARHKV